MAQGQVWYTDTLGGYMYAPNLSKVLRMAVRPTTKFRQFTDAKDAGLKVKHAGEAYHWNVYSKVANQGGQIAENEAMPETNFTITQGTMTVTEYGNSVPFSQKLDDLSAQPVKDIINKVLKEDARIAFDQGAHAQFNKTPLRVVAANGTDAAAVTLYTNGTVTGTNNVTLNLDHAKAIEDLMKERNIPPYEGDDYFCVAHPSTFRPFKNQFEALAKYTGEGFAKLVNGEAGKFGNTRYVEQTAIPKANWANGKSNWAYWFGADTAVEGIVTPEEMRGKIPTDYGRSMGIAWYYLGGFGIVHTDPVQARIVKWDSQG